MPRSSGPISAIGSRRRRCRASLERARHVESSVPLGLPAADIRGTIREASPATLERVQEFDRYQGRGVPEGHCSISLRLTFRAPDRTLTESEVQAASDGIVAALAARHAAVSARDIQTTESIWPSPHTPSRSTPSSGSKTKSRSSSRWSSTSARIADSTSENKALSDEVASLRKRLVDAEGTTSELAALRQERDQVGAA